MTMLALERILIVMLCLMIFVSLRNFLEVYRNIRYFLKSRTYNKRKDPTKFYIIVPLMNEPHIKELVQALSSLNYPTSKIVIILATTIRERNKKGVNPTHKIAEEVAAICGKQKTSPRIEVIECTKKVGYVATQIKFAIDQLGAEIQDDDFLLIYNADSLPGRDTLWAADNLLQQLGAQVDVMQQSSLFTKNINAMLQKKSFTAAANAVHQSLWTLKHEVGMTRRQSRLSQRSLKGAGLIKRMWRTRFTVCVGHGLFIRKKYYDQHPLNEDASIEDTQYGLYQSLNRISVYPIPILENSESPSTFKRVLAQKRTWFNMVFDLARLFKAKGKRIFQEKKQRAEFLSVLLQVAAIYVVWFLHSFLIIASIVLAVTTGNLLLILLAICFYILYWLAPALLLAHYHDKLVADGKLRMLDVAVAWLLGSPTILTHSLGPWFAIVDKIRGTGGRKKTER